MNSSETVRDSPRGNRVDAGLRSFRRAAAETREHGFGFKVSIIIVTSSCRVLRYLRTGASRCRRRRNRRVTSQYSKVCAIKRKKQTARYEMREKPERQCYLFTVVHAEQTDEKQTSEIASMRFV